MPQGFQKRKEKFTMLTLDLSMLEGFVSPEQLSSMADEVAAAHAKLYDSTAPGADFTGWVRLPQDYDKDEFARIQKAAAKIRSDSQVLVVIGIGGSYLGARTALEIFPSNGPEVCFVGCSLSPNELKKVMDKVAGRDWSINIISKSGGTTEPAVAFRVFRDLLVKQYGAEADRRIYATTDKARGALKSLADKNGWKSFVIPDEWAGGTPSSPPWACCPSPSPERTSARSWPGRRTPWPASTSAPWTTPCGSMWPPAICCTARARRSRSSAITNPPTPSWASG
jgi:glucose-6-phosphate isomerase